MLPFLSGIERLGPIGGSVGMPEMSKLMVSGMTVSSLIFLFQFHFFLSIIIEHVDRLILIHMVVIIY